MRDGSLPRSGGVAQAERGGGARPSAATWERHGGAGSEEAGGAGLGASAGARHRPLDPPDRRVPRAARGGGRRHARRRAHQAALARALAGAGIAYVHVPQLGGLRRARRDSQNGAWRNASFRGYADHMQTPEFEEGLCNLRALAKAGPVAIMCAEAVPWRCHRSLVADALLARGVVVEHVVGKGKTRPHRLTPFARIEGRSVTYPPPPDAAESAGR